ncbi:MAG: multiprotein bridging factor aMBF1 [Methanobrevibacter boviskoreani]|jgi:putative transcription factor|uniref:multiprotein bridging factor aMBF1 n=1 Tax=Methanobrevibacter TaxID=2172 RepID=UPI000594EECC|nr:MULTISPECIES: multiprotein bridging factor aMBF1 [Methanobrevibacter]MCI6774690.1 multiprotein bridging factor aMBF1 [Methanobrevibacter boviskoreani]MCI6929926.1 multiprotein bridging factor aMBF1 [Methanobrevibacter boviskoreani]MDD6257044.1 multiprotein bridging factor aMBF1 [Methanobrevibacter boviskoreani]MDY5613813.1 multiprotein bridging factor aMBF1 [Methanobrevibacter boviskoreani]
MDCEMCGQPIKGQPIRIKIDGATMDVCKECSKFGKVQKVPRRPKYVQKNKKSGKNNSNNNKNNYSRRPEEPTDELIENYGKVVRQGREAQHLSREQLGEKVFEKVSVIAKIESEKMEPDIKTAKKLEKALNINLIEKVEPLDLETMKNISSGANTIGSIVKFKKSKK